MHSILVFHSEYDRADIVTKAVSKRSFKEGDLTLTLLWIFYVASPKITSTVMPLSVCVPP